MKRVFAVTRGCTYCGMCVVSCPAKAIVFSEKGARIDPEKCVGCGACKDNCASEAIVEVSESQASIS